MRFDTDHLCTTLPATSFLVHTPHPTVLAHTARPLVHGPLRVFADGLDDTHVELVGEYPEWTVYEWPSGVRKNGRMGQAQRWFTFRVRSSDVAPEPDGVEFVDWKWVEPSWLIDQVVEVRRPSYRRVLEDA